MSKIQYHIPGVMKFQQSLSLVEKLDSMTIIKVSIDGEQWNLVAPPGSTVTANGSGRPMLKIPGILDKLYPWEVIEWARNENMGLKVLGVYYYGTNNYLRCLWSDITDPTL